jgi:uncharacterized protein YbjT (DUF2867 family)
VILRPALVLGSAVYGGTAMLRGIAAFPGLVPVVHADARIQVVGLDDVAETVTRALAPDMAARTVWEIAHPQVHRLADIVTAIRAWLGFRPRRVVALPDAIAGVVARLADAPGWLGWWSRRVRRHWRSLPQAWSAIRRAGLPRPGSRPKASRRSWQRGRQARRIAGSPGSICSSRWRSWGWR